MKRALAKRTGYGPGPTAAQSCPAVAVSSCFLRNDLRGIQNPTDPPTPNGTEFRPGDIPGSRAGNGCDNPDQTCAAGRAERGLWTRASGLPDRLRDRICHDPAGGDSQLAEAQMRPWNRLSGLCGKLVERVRLKSAIPPQTIHRVLPATESRCVWRESCAGLCGPIRAERRAGRQVQRKFSTSMMSLLRWSSWVYRIRLASGDTAIPDTNGTGFLSSVATWTTRRSAKLRNCRAG